MLSESSELDVSGLNKRIDKLNGWLYGFNSLKHNTGRYFTIKAICVNINGYPPHFYVNIPNNWPEIITGSFRSVARAGAAFLSMFLKYASASATTSYILTLMSFAISFHCCEKEKLTNTNIKMINKDLIYNFRAI